jgi:membrane protein required for colicin V production
MSASTGLSPVDVVLLAVLAVSAAVGVWRGFLYEAASLAGWVVAYVAARRLSPSVMAWMTLEGWMPESWSAQVASAAAFAAVFLAVLLTWALAAKLLRRLVHATPLQWPDRLAGAVFGLVRGAVVLVVLATLVSWTPLREHEAWQASQGREWIERLVEGLKPFWPSALADGVFGNTEQA